MKKSWKITALILGIIFDILFWKKNPGISFAIFVSLCLFAGYQLFRSEHIPHARINLLLLIPIVFFSMMTFIRQDPFTSLINYTLVLVTAGILTMTYQSGLWPSFSIIDYITNLFRLVGSILKFPIFTPSKDSSDLASKNEEGTKNTIWPIIRGLLLAIPVLFIFISLFSSADLIFNQRINSLIANLNIEKLPEYIFRGIYILLIANFLAGVFNNAATNSQNKDLIGVDKPVVAPFLGFTEAGIILGSVLLLFLSFVGIQFRYFFFGNSNITLAGFTYAEYARRGFGELIAAAFLSLILLLSLNTIAKRTSNQQKKIFSFLFIGLVGSVLIILVSSFQRLLLYEAAYGFSQLRTYSHVFMIWLGILLTAVVIIEIIDRPRVFGNIALLALIGFSASLNLLNVDAFIARQNIGRTSLGKDLDVSHLTSLTNDSVPTLVKAYLSSNLSENARDGIGAALVCFQVQEDADKAKIQTWQSFHLSDWKAERELEKVQQQLSEYQIQNEDWSTVVISPDGFEYPCQGYYWFD
ncbi:MAG: DUF4173 domain-containing protein [Pelolinea sp.]|nr:DUF4173 domain-containing protein [Pelolinea sp.]